MAILGSRATRVHIHPGTASRQERFFTSSRKPLLDFVHCFPIEHDSKLLLLAIQEAEGRNGAPHSIVQFPLHCRSRRRKARIERSKLVILPFEQSAQEWHPAVCDRPLQLIVAEPIELD